MRSMVHFRGIPVGYGTEFAPMCSTRADPVTGEVTTEASRVDCPECRLALRLTARQWTPSKPGAASRELLAGKHWTEPEERDQFADGDARSET